MKALLFILLTPLVCFGQSPLITGSGIDWGFQNPKTDLTGLLPSGKYVWFNWNDLSSSPVSIWTDRIQGWTLIQATGGNQPTWDSTNGVQFNGSTSFLQSSNFSPNNSDEAVLVIGEFNDVGAHHMMVSSGNLTSGTVIGMDNAATLRDNLNGSSGDKPIGAVIYDFIAVKTNSPNAYQFYTNGVVGAFANVAFSYNGASGITTLGATTVPDNFLNGKIWEVIVWTNQTWTPLTVSNVHYYAVHNTPNLITSQPSGIVALAANSQSINVGAISGCTYQWRKSGANIAGATASAFTFTSTSDSGYYDCVVSSLGRFQISATVSNAIVTTATVSNWCVMVTSNGGVFPSLPTISTVDTFYNGVVTDGIDSKMLIVNCMVPDNLTACLTPLVKGGGAALWVNHNFVSGDLSVNGLHGNASTKYVDTGLVQNTLTANDNGNVRYYYATNTVAGADNGAQIFPNGFFLQMYGTVVFCADYNQTAGQGQISATAPDVGGLVSIQRTAANAASLYFANSSHSHSAIASIATSGGSLVALNMWLFVLNNNGTQFGYSDMTCSFEAYTKGLNSTQDANLYSRVQTMRTSFGGGFR